MGREAPRSRRSRGGLLAHGARIGLATAIAGGANYASNIVLGRALDEDAFADAALTVSGLLLFTAVALGFQMITARSLATGGGIAAIRAAHRRARATGLTVAACLLIASAPLAELTGMATRRPVALLAVSVPLFFDLAVRRGAVQASGHFATLAVSLALEGVSRLVAIAIALASGLGAASAGVGIIVSLVVSSFACGRLTECAESGAASRAATGGRPTLLLLAGQVVIANGDLWIVSAFLPDRVGSYAGVALFGRLILVVASSVVTVVFPSLVKAGQSEDGDRLLRSAVLLTAAMGAAFAAVVAVSGGMILRLMLGEGRDGDAAFMGPYALATSLLTVVNVVGVADIARARMRTPLLVALAAVTQTALLIGLARFGIAVVVGVQVAVMSVLALLVLPPEFRNPAAR